MRVFVSRVISKEYVYSDGEEHGKPDTRSHTARPRLHGPDASDFSCAHQKLSLLRLRLSLLEVSTANSSELDTQ